MTNEILTKIDALRSNPQGIQNLIIDQVEKVYNDGSTILVDPSNPFIHALEAATLTAVGVINSTETATRKLYPELSTTQEDLYRHMSDHDYIGRFAVPSNAPFNLVLSLDEIKQKAVLDSKTGMRKLVIPRDTTFFIAGYEFGIHYPIEIRILSHGGVQVVYQVEEVSPLQTLETNTLEWDETNIQGTVFVNISIPVQQFSLTPNYFTITPASGFIENFPFTDQFYYARVYHGSESTGWTEMHSTHSDQVYDPKAPTALLQVQDNLLRVEIPQVYYTSNQLGAKIRVDIYTTRGELELILNDYSSGEFGATWNDYSNGKDTPFIAPLSTLASLGIYSAGSTVGGRNALPIDDLRQRVIYGATTKQVPVSDEALSLYMEDRGYTILKRLDGITDRAYQATRELPSANSDSISSSIGTLSEEIRVSVDTLRLMSTVYDNNERVTISPKTLYRYENGLIKMLSDDDRNTLNGLSGDRLIRELNNSIYLYTPFHYVIDLSENALEVRPYYLNVPEIVSRRFIAENVHIPIQTTTQAIQIEKLDTGYRVLLLVNKGNIEEELSLEQLQVQLGILPNGETQQAYLNGSYIGVTEDDSAYVYEFILESNFDVNEEGLLGLTNVRMYEDDIQTHYVDLKSEFSIYYALDDYPIVLSKRSEIDQRMGTVLLSSGSVGNTEEACTVDFGKSLDGLRSDSRSVISSLEYETYQSNVPMVHEADVYERENGLIKYTIDSETGAVSYNLLHRKGDPVLNELGEPVFKHLVGETKLDANGEPIVKQQRKMDRQFVITLFDARYLYTSNEEAVAYRDTIADVIVSYLLNDIKSASATLLERTALKFSPRRTIGNIAVTVRNGSVVNIPSAQSFKVKYFMTEIGYRDLSLRRSVTESTNEVIAAQLRKTTVTVNEIEEALRLNAGDEVVTVSVSGLGNTNDMVVYSVIDPTAVSSLATRLELSNDGTIDLVDDVSIEFERHSS